jgi:hypothetical protein
MVREGLADGLRRACSSCVLRVLARLCLRSIVILSFCWVRFRTVRVSQADSPRAPRGRSVIRGSLLEVLLGFTDSPRLRTDSPRLRTDSPPYPCGQFAVRSRTVRVPRADSPPLLAGRSARAWLLCSLVRFLPTSFVLPRVLQGIVPKT